MRRRHYPRKVPPPVASLRLAAVGRNGEKPPLDGWVRLGAAEVRVLRKASSQLHRVPDCVKDKGVRLSAAERRALKEKQSSFLSIEAYPQYSGEKEEG